jgi:hypothetical protein
VAVGTLLVRLSHRTATENVQDTAGAGANRRVDAGDDCGIRNGFGRADRYQAGRYGTFEGLRSPATIAQLHRSPVKGVRGPVIFDLVVKADGTSGTLSGTLELTPIQVADLEKGRLYIQLHSEKAPDGNLWGWLTPQENKR